jgi:hypothetical protein
MRTFSVLQATVIPLIIVTLFLYPLWASEEAEKVQNEKYIYTVIEFESSFMNRKKEKVLKVLGVPDIRRKHNGKEVWTYQNIIREQGKVWHQNIMFDFGRINMMWGEPSSRGKQ